MSHQTGLIATLAAGFGLAFLLGIGARRLRLPPLVGYLLAGVAIGPFTAGYDADVALAAQLAEFGVILLMFGVGLHFSLADLLAVRRIVIPGGLLQIALAGLLGFAVARLWNWSLGASVVFGLSVSVASTVVLLKTLEERGLLGSAEGRIAVGWLIVQDIAMVLALVLLPAVALALGDRQGDAGGASAAGGAAIAAAFAITLAKVAAFIALMLFVGRRAVPWLLERVARLGSRELFTLGVLAVALGVAVGASSLFGVSFALGAFFAGVVISESDLSHQAAADALPLQDAFAVLFFVSVGMLFDPTVVVREPGRVVATVLIILVGTPLITATIVRVLGHPLRTALTIAASLTQIGEFSFIVTGLGITLGLLPDEARSLVLAGSLISITANPLVFAVVDPLERWIHRHPRLHDALEPRSDTELPSVADRQPLRDHAVLVGYGRVGGTIGEALDRHRVPYVVVERDRMVAERLSRQGVPVVFGDAARAGILDHVDLATARLLVVAAPDPYHARRIVELARKANRDVATIVRTHSAPELDYLERIGVTRAVMGERELAFGMAHYALMSLGLSDDEADETIDVIRRGNGVARADGHHGSPAAGRATT